MTERQELGSLEAMLFAHAEPVEPARLADALRLDAAEVTTSPENFTAGCEALEKKGYKFISADVAQVPSTTTALTDPDQLVQMGKLLDALDDDDDVQNAWHTLENEEDLDR